MALITVDDVKTELSNQPCPEDETLLQNIVAGVWGLWEQLTARVWEQAAITEYHNVPEDDRKRLYLRQYPVASITSIHDDADWEYGDGALIDPSQYVFDQATGIVYYKSFFDAGLRNIKAVYTAGYTAATFPASIKQVLIRQAALWYKQAKDFSDYEKQSTLLEEFTLLSEKLRRRNA